LGVSVLGSKNEHVAKIEKQVDLAVHEPVPFRANICRSRSLYPVASKVSQRAVDAHESFGEELFRDRGASRFLGNTGS
jgi:hypothetical protein